MSKDDVNFVSNTNGMKDNDKVENNSSMLFGGERRTMLWLEKKKPSCGTCEERMKPKCQVSH